jgi:hypothetical protein
MGCVALLVSEGFERSVSGFKLSIRKVSPHIEIKILSMTLKIQQSLNFYANTKWKL